MNPTNVLAKLKKLRFALAAFLLLLIALYWALCFRQRKHVLEAIPSQAALVLTFRGIDQFNAALLSMPKELRELSLLQVLQADIQRSLYFLKGDSLQAPQLLVRAVAAGFSLQSVDSLHPAIILDMEQRSASQELIDRIKVHPKAQSSNFKGHTIYAIRSGGKDQMVAARLGNLFIFSRYSYLVEDALIQANNREQWWMKPLGAVAVQEVPFQIAVRPELIAERCRGEMFVFWQDLPEWLNTQLEWLRISWSGEKWETAIQAKRNMRPGSSRRPSPDAINTILPDNTAFFLWSGFEQSIRLADLVPNGRANADFKNFVESWIGTEAAFVLLEPYSPNMWEDQFWVLSAPNEALAESALKAYGDQRGLVKKYNYQTYEVRQFLSQSLLVPLLSDRRRFFVNPLCALINGYVVFAASPSAMELWIDKYIVSQTLNNQPDYLLMKQRLPQKGNLQAYFNADYLPQLVKQLFVPSFFENHSRDIQLLQHTGIIGWDLQSDKKNGIVGKFTHQALSATSQNTSILWKTALTAPAITAPCLVRSELEGEDAAVLIQDSEYQLYRLSANGSVLWRKQLDLPILSAIQGIDFYKNGKACYVFNTADAVWVLDDDGIEMVGYPLHLQSPATNGVSVIEFDGDKNYSFFIACQNGNLYGFDQFGRPLPGWNPQSGVGRIKHSLIHFKNENKDYLAALNNSGELFAFNRNGSPHFPAVQFSGTFFASPPQFDAGAASPRIVCANDAGRVFVCNLSGQNFALDLSGATKQQTHNFVFEVLFGDSRKEYAMLNGRQLSISGYEGAAFKKRYSVSYPVPLDTLFQAGCCQRLGGLNKEKKQIFLINAQGKIIPGFPLAGTTPFCLMQATGNRPGRVLIVGNMESVYAYKVN